MIKLNHTYPRCSIESYLAGVLTDADSLSYRIYRNGVLESDSNSLVTTSAKISDGLKFAQVATLGTGDGWATTDELMAWVDATISAQVYSFKFFDAATIIDDTPESGARTVTITVNDGSTVLQGARVRMTSASETYIRSTDASGHAAFNLDDATWTVAITKAGYTFSGASLAVSADTTHTYSMSQVSFTPSDPGETTGFITVARAGAAVEGAVVEVEVMKLANGTTGSGISNPLFSGTTDSEGVAEFPGLPRLATYRVRIDEGEWFKGTTLDADSTPLVGSLGPAE
jgi:hypothetical protein